MRTVTLIGAPTDIGAAHRGTTMGPDALRAANLADTLTRKGLKVVDYGNIQGPPNPWLPPVNGCRHLSETIIWSRTVYEAIYRKLTLGHMPIMLGGDHSLALGSISAVARYCRERERPLRVLWLDSHADFNTIETTPTGNIHGMPVACLCGYGPKELIELSGQIPAVSPSIFRQIGVRSIDPYEKLFAQKVGLETYDMKYINKFGIQQAIEQSLRNITPDTHLHVSFDVDFLDPMIAPGVGTAVQGGLTYPDAQLCMELIAKTRCMASLDIVELNPAFDRYNQTAQVTVNLMESLFAH
jgi:arginase